MDVRDLERIDEFLARAGKPSLLEFYGISASTPPTEVEELVRRKRDWAQAQQANPKFKDVAIWLIKHHALVRRVLLEELEAYSAAVEERTRARRFDLLEVFVQGCLVNGAPTPTVEDGIRRHAASLGLAGVELEEWLVARLPPRETDGASHVYASDRAPPTISLTPRPPLPDAKPTVPDYYGLLQVAPDVTPEALEEAYRKRYRWARSLRDISRAQQVYRQLEEAWAILSSPERRREYDSKRAQAVEEVLDPPEPPAEAWASGEILPGEEYRSDDWRPAGAGAPPPEAPAPSLPPEASARPLPPEAPTRSLPPGEAVVSLPPFGGPASGGSRGPVRLSASSSDPGDADLVTEERAAPPIPRSDGGIRSFIPGGPAAPARPRPTPRLVVDGPTRLDLRVGLRSVSTNIKVQNAGRGDMRGHVASSQPWLVVEPTALIPDRPTQQIRVLVDPRKMSGARGTGRVTVTTSHGERWIMSVEVRRSRGGAVVLGLAAVGLVALLALLLPSLVRPPATSPDARTVLELQVAPPADAVWVNGRRVGRGARVRLEDPAPPGTPMTIRVVRDGYAPYDEQIILVDGQRLVRELVLRPDREVP